MAKISIRNSSIQYSYTYTNSILSYSLQEDLDVCTWSGEGTEILKTLYLAARVYWRQPTNHYRETYTKGSVLPQIIPQEG